MKRFLVYITVFFTVIACGALIVNTSTEKEETLVNVLSHSLETYHFQPRHINDEFSKEAYDLYIDRLDHYKRFLIASDIDLLNKYQSKVDDELNSHSFDFFELSLKLIEERVGEAQKVYQEYLSKPFSFDKEESVELDADKLSFAKNKKDLKERWRLNLKYSVLAKVWNLEQKQEKAKEKDPENYVEKSFKEIEIEAREKVLKSHDQWFKRLNQLNRTDRMSVYLNSVTSTFDPHTSYFPPKDKANFDISLSGRLEGIGATLQEKDGYIKVIRIVAGSASWRQGELKSGDIILKVAQGEEEPVDVVDMRLDDAVQLIRGKKGTEVRLTVEKIDGTEQIIPIVRDVVVLEETYAKSMILRQDESAEKVGYIKLPKFYADFNRNGGRSCATDVKNEIAKLKKEGAGKLIIDLRDNGGGSLQDVVDMAGLFIKSGPIVQVKGKVGSPYILKDTDTLTQFTGPLIIMVNSLSASASEILAAAMQDYGRAIIIGSASTYGKGTVQRMIGLDEILPQSMNDLKPLGALKLTIQKFYRINGGATQLKGVEPDIVLPDQYMYLDFGEREIDQAMAWDEISPAKYAQVGRVKNKVDLVSSSKGRTENSEIFTKIDAKAKHMKASRDMTLYPLSYELFKTKKENDKAENKKYEKIMKTIDGFQVENLVADVEALQSDTSKVARNDEFIKNLKKDSYIYESIQVLNEME